MKKPLFSLVAAFGLLATAATAQTATPAARPHAEQARIRRGVANGRLTRAEAARLRTRKADDRQDRVAARADGVVTRDEHQDLRRDNRQTSRAIYRRKHNGQVRPHGVR